MYYKNSVLKKTKNTLCIKKVRGQHGSVNRYARLKTLISAEAKKLLIKNLFNYLNDWFCHLGHLHGGQVTKPIIDVKTVEKRSRDRSMEVWASLVLTTQYCKLNFEA